MRMAECHPERKHFVKGMCRQCYAKSRYTRRIRAKKSTVCGHHDRPHAGDGLCQSCFAIRKRARQGERGRISRKDSELRRRYGITLAEFEAMYASQGHACALCREPIKTERGRHVDHCHETGEIRGVLCSKCNNGLGMLGDNEAGLLRALDYLRAERGVFIVEEWEDKAA